MALYLGDKKVKLYTDSVLHKLNLYSAMNETMLLSADGYILKDSNGLFLTIKKESA